VVVCSIFVNPTQFNNAQDYAKYPSTTQADIDLLLDANCDILFLPSVQEIYPNGTQLSYTYDINALDTILEGAFRPGHFQGVCTVVHRLLQIIPAQHLYLGIKDYQQCAVISAMIQLLGLPVQVHKCSTLREANGLAKSSRNKRLSSKGMEQASSIYAGLSYIAQQKYTKSFAQCQAYYNASLVNAGLQPEHLLLAHANTLQALTEFDNKQPMVLLTAAFCEGVRLIDNLVI
jgi:pantoate--beta-alanine ligase